jgi:hypothetical protein
MGSVLLAVIAISAIATVDASFGGSFEVDAKDAWYACSVRAFIILFPSILITIFLCFLQQWW